MPASKSNCAGSSEQICCDINRAQYMVKSEGILYALTPVNSATGSIAERATLGWSKALSIVPGLCMSASLPDIPEALGFV
jgi:hypothetical protein